MLLRSSPNEVLRCWWWKLPDVSPFPCPLFLPLFGEGWVTGFLSYEHPRKRLAISCCALWPSQWGSPLRGSKAGCSSLQLPAPQQDCRFPTNILNFLQSKMLSANLPVGGMFTQMRHLRLCLSSGVIYHDTIPCLAQRKKSGCTQKATLWQRKTSVISETTNIA